MSIMSARNVRSSRRKVQKRNVKRRRPRRPFCERLEARNLLAAAPLDALPEHPPAIDVAGAFGQLPLSFEPNVGQADQRYDYISRGGQSVLGLSSTGAALHWAGGDNEAGKIEMTLVGGDPAAEGVARHELPGEVNYFIGDDPAGHHTGVDTFSEVIYTDVYRGIDVVYYGTAARRLEYDFIVEPGASHDVITLSFAGADDIAIDDQGNLVLTTAAGRVLQERPVIYQQTESGRSPVDGAYRLDGRQVRFDVGEYDRSLPLVIDPVVVYSTFIGGAQRDMFSSIDVDGAGNAYIAGWTQSPELATNGAFDDSLHGPDDLFVARLNPQGALVALTYLGGNGDDQVFDIELDPNGDGVWVASEGSSTDYPTQNPFQAANGGSWDHLITKLDLNLSTLLYSTYFGGSGVDLTPDITVDAAGNVYGVGVTDSADFPLNGAVEAAHAGGARWDYAVYKLDSANNTLDFGTYLGGTGEERRGNPDIAVDANQSIYVAGATRSTDFPTTANAVQGALQGNYDALLTKYDLASGSYSLKYSTYLGGSNDDFGRDVELDGADVYLGGTTASSNFPAKNNNAGGQDAFIVRFEQPFNNQLNLLEKVYLGGSQNDSLGGLKLAGGSVFVTGSTSSGNFPTTPSAVQLSLAGPSDAFVSELAGNLSSVMFSTFYGGQQSDSGSDVALDADREIYFVGTTTSPDFPTVNAMQPNHGGNRDVFAAKLGCNLVVTHTGNSGLGSLQSAIACANPRPGVDVIRFLIPVPSPHTISPTVDDPLPPITDPVIINGLPDDGGCVAIKQIVIDGSSAGPTSGLHVLAGNSTIRGLAINNFQHNGLLLDTGGNNRVTCNNIGTDAAGSSAMPNGFAGIAVQGGSALNQIGEAGFAGGNVISGNRLDGVRLAPGSFGNTIQANRIGVAANGVDPLGNGGDGVSILDSDGNLVGGPITNQGNVISANGFNGVSIAGTQAFHNQLLNNAIGTDASGLAPFLGNARHGVVFGDGSLRNGIGDGAKANGNAIAFNGQDGVAVFGTRSNSIRANSIYENNHIGIDLAVSPGVTLNDTPVGNEDVDAGPNLGQNFPELVSVTDVGAALNILFRVPSTAGNSPYPLQVEFFKADAGGEGKEFLGAAVYTTPLVLDSVSLNAPSVNPGDEIVATATTALGDTSEFSVPLEAGSCVLPPDDMIAWIPLNELAGNHALDIENGVQGDHHNGPVPFPGAVVAGGLHFDGVNDFVSFPDRRGNQDLYDVGTRDFSIDFWIRANPSDNPGIVSVLDKRDERPQSVTGYHVYLFNGRLGFQMSDGSFTNYTTTRDVADGDWHFVAITVDRDEPDGGKIFVDDRQVHSFNPTGRQGNLSNDGPLVLGQRSSSPTGNFNGDLDEVEIFMQAVPDAEMLSIFNAGGAGKCRPHIGVITTNVLTTSGVVATNIPAGGQFVLEVRVEDLTENPGGVFSAYVDALFDSELVEVVGDVEIGSVFMNGRSGSPDTPGLIDEVGGFAGATPIGPGEVTLFRVLMRAKGEGTATFSEPADAPNHEVSFFGRDGAVAPSQLRFESASIEVTPRSWHNHDRPTDVNGDGQTTPNDVLWIINEINRVSDSAGMLPDDVTPPPFLDVNGDGSVTPLDALQVINMVNAQASDGEGEGEDDTAARRLAGVAGEVDNRGPLVGLEAGVGVAPHPVTMQFAAGAAMAPHRSVVPAGGETKLFAPRTQRAAANSNSFQPIDVEDEELAPLSLEWDRLLDEIAEDVAAA